MKDAWPVKAQALGGRHYRGNSVDQNFDNYSVEYTFADGTKLFFYGRSMPGCHNEFASYAHGTQGLGGHLDVGAHAGQGAASSRARTSTKDDLVWAFPQPEPSPYQLEWDDLIDAIRQDKPYNEVKRGAEASLVTSMGRMAAHTGQIVTYDEMLNCEHEFAPDVDKLTMDSPRAAAGRRRRQVPGAAAGHAQEARVLMPSIPPSFRRIEKETVMGIANKAAGLADEFKKFALKGNVIDLAIGVIIGAAFGKIIDSLVKHIIMPLISVVLPGEQGYPAGRFDPAGRRSPTACSWARSSIS